MRYIPILILSLVVSSCTPARGGDSAVAVELGSPAPGIRCFAIQDYQGHTVAGNCLKE